MVDVDEFLYPSLDKLLGLVSKENAKAQGGGLQGASLGSMSINLKRPDDYSAAIKHGMPSLPDGYPSCNGTPCRLTRAH